MADKESSTSQLTPISTPEAEYVISLPQAATDEIQRYIDANRLPYEHEMLTAMRGTLEPNQVVVDIGANVGNHSLYLRVACHAQVFAYEPDPRLVEAIHASIDANNITSGITVKELALGSSRHLSTLVDDTPGNLGGQHLSETPHAAGQTVQVIRLDDESFPNTVRALKIDVEGHEMHVLKGATKLLESDHPDVWVECLNQESYTEISDFLRTLGYEFNATYNASPTHHFTWSQEPSDSAHQARLSQLMTRFYHDHESYLTTRALLNESNLKYRSVHEQLAQVRAQYSAINPSNVSSDTQKTFDEVDRVAQQITTDDRAHRLEVELADTTSKYSRLAIETRAQITHLLDTVSTLQSQLAKTRSSHSAESSEHQAAISKLNDHIHTLQEEASSALNHRQNIEKELGEAQGRLAELRLKESRANQELCARQDNIERLSATITQRDEQLAAMHELVATTEIRARTLEETTAHTTAQIAELKAINEDLARRHNHYRTDFNLLREYVDTTSTQIETLETQRADLATDNSNLLKANKVAANQLSQSQRQSIRRRKEIENLHAEVENLRAANSSLELELRQSRAATEHHKLDSASNLRKLKELRGSKTFKAGTAIREATTWNGFFGLIPSLYRILTENDERTK